MIFNHILEYCMKKSKLVILITITIVICAVAVYPKVNKTFLPNFSSQAISVAIFSPTKNTAQMADLIMNDYLPTIEKGSLLNESDKRILIAKGSATVYFYFDKIKNINVTLREIRWLTQQFTNSNTTVANKTSIKLVTSNAPHIIIDLYGNVPYRKLKKIAKAYFVNYFNHQDYCKQANIESDVMPMVNVKLNMEKLAEYRLSSLQVTNAILKNIHYEPISLTNTSAQFKSIQLDSTSSNINSVKNILLKYTDNKTPIFLKDLATISVNDLNYHLLKKLNNQNLIQVKLTLENNINQLHYETKIHSYYQSIKNRLSSESSIKMRYHAKLLKDITKRTNSLYFCISISFVFIIIFLFLSHPNLAFVISASTAIPLSIGVYILYLYIFGIPLDTVALSAICIGIGFLIDDSILVKESIMQKISQYSIGTDALKKTIIEATSQVIKPVIYTSVIMVIIFTVACQVPDNIAIRQIYISFSIATLTLIIVSTLDALIVTPVVLWALLSREKHPGSLIANPFSKYFQASISALQDIYAKKILFFSNKLTLLIMSVLIVIILSFFMTALVEKSFLPPLEFSLNHYDVKVTPKVTLDQKQLLAQSTIITRKILSQPGVIEVVTLLHQDMNKKNTFDFIVQLKNSRYNIQNILENSIPPSSYSYFLQQTEPLNTFSRFQNAQTSVSFVLQGKNPDILESKAKELKSLLIQSYPITVSTSFGDTVTRPIITTDKTKAIEYGINNKTLTAELQALYSSTNIGSININNKKTNVELSTNQSQNIKDSFSQILIPNINHNLINLNKFSSLQQTSAREKILYMKEKVAILFSADPSVYNVSVGDVHKIINKFINNNRHSQLSVRYLGESEQFNKLINIANNVIILSSLCFLLLTLIVLRSFILSLAALIIYPTAHVGGMIMLYLFHAPYNAYSSGGLFVIASVSVKSFLVIFDKINSDLANCAHIDDNALKSSIKSSCLNRFRPILLTTLTLLLSSSTLLLDFGFNTTNYYKSLSLVIIGGSITSTILSYYFYPVYFIFSLN